MHLRRYFLLLLLLIGNVCIGNAQTQTTVPFDTKTVTDDSVSRRRTDTMQSETNAAKDAVILTQKPTASKANILDDSDSVILSKTRYYYYHPFEFNILEVFHPNYDQTGCHQPDDLLKLDSRYYAHQANVGRSHLSLFFEPKYGGAFRYQPNAFDAYLFTLNNIKFYQLEKPYTELEYYGALGGEYFFNATHSQNILPNWNIAFEDHLISTEGIYANSSALNNYMNVTTHFFTKNGRYKVRAAYIYNFSKQQENGGIAIDSLFTKNIQTTRDAIPINLQQASTRWREMNTFVEQMFSLHKPDTVIGKGLPFNFGAIGYNIHFQRGYRIYSDQMPNNEFYRNFYIDSTQSHDSSGYWKLENTIFWTNDVYSNHVYRNPFRVVLGVRHQLIEAIDTRQSENLFTLSPLAKIQFDFGKLMANFSAEYILGNKYNEGDYTFSGQLVYALNPSNKFKISTNLSEQDPEYFYSYYHSNNFEWENPEFEKERILDFGAEHDWKGKTNIGVRYYICKNSVFLDENINPLQHGTTQGLLQIYTGEKLKWGIFHLDNFAALQFAENKDIFRLPLLEFKQSYYFQFWTFRKSIQLQTGFDLRYNTAYYGDAYSPALAAFYRQNEIETGNNLWLDIFISGQIKRAFIFLKFTHVNALFDSTPTYYMIPHYPTQDFAFKWGFIWKFFD